MPKKIKYPYEYNEKARKIAKLYTRIKIINGIISDILSIAVLAIIFYSGAAYYLAFFAMQLSGAYFLQALVMGFLLTTVLNICRLPLGFYSGYIIEHRYGLSNQSFAEWVRDYGKGIFLGYLIFLPIISIVYFLISSFAEWWIYASVFSLAIYLFLDFIYPVVIFPFFYKTRAYRDMKQIKRLKEMALRAGVKVSRVLVAMESEKSKKANAMFAGFGETKRIVLFDTLLESFTPDEIETVVAHELAHYANRDIYRFFLLEAAKTFVSFYLIYLVLQSAAGDAIPSAGHLSGMPLFMLAFSVIELFAMPAVNTYSRRRESEADRFSLEVCQKPDAQISSEKRLADMNLSDDRPHPAVEFLLYTHPAAWRRVKMAEDFRKKK
ncbi:MAG: M48 family metallopeptidase [Candidatus Aenigmarchaeota archaeon]|nr:M48 family metallopeptidase [Candidatus Aenigmarchaeota archaeon]